MKKIVFLVTMFLFASFLAAASAVEVPRMSKEELRDAMSAGEVVIMDTRSDKDWKSSEFKIKGAIRTAFGATDEWLPSITKDSEGKKLVIYCTWKNEGSSAGLARTLIEKKGFKNVYALKGGWKEWYKQEDKEAYPIEKK